MELKIEQVDNGWIVKYDGPNIYGRGQRVFRTFAQVLAFAKKFQDDEKRG